MLIVAGGTAAPPDPTVLELARLARTEHDASVTALLLDRGDAGEWAEVADVRQPTATAATARRVADTTGHHGRLRTPERSWLRRELGEAYASDVVVAASGPALLALEHMPDPTPPVVAVLPLADRDDDGGSPFELLDRLRRAVLTVVPSRPVLEWATRSGDEGGLGLEPDRLLHHPAARPVAVAGPRVTTAPTQIVGSGPLGWRGGTDLFVSLAAILGSQIAGRPARWTWIGDPDPDGTGDDVLAEIERRRIEDLVRIVPAAETRAEQVASADLYVATARDDPFPAAVVDAAAAGTAVVGFTPATALLGDAGREDARIADLDVAALALRVVNLVVDGEARAALAADIAAAAAAATEPAPIDDLWAAIELAAGRVP